MSIMRINVGPIHPSTHGVLRLVVDVDGDTIKNVEPHIGFLHRGVEKLMETRMYMMNPSYTEKLDYIAPMSWDDLYVSAVENATKVEVKERAKYVRMVLLEFQRIASHLLWLGTFCNDIGQMFTIFMWAFRERSQVLKFLEDITGSRMFYVNYRLGGMQSDLPPDFAQRALDLTDYLESHISQYKDVIDADPIFNERTSMVAVLPRQEAIDMGVSGPVLRAAGVKEDTRKSKPYYFYDRMKFKVPMGYHSDAYDRYKVRYQEMFESIKIIRQAIMQMPQSGDIKGMPIKLIGPNASQEPISISRELPRGEGMIYMIPDKQRPYRISLRSPAFINLYSIKRITKGARYADLFAALGSLDVVMAEIDK